MSGIPKTPDHCAARDYAHDHGLKLHDTCNRCTNPNFKDPSDCEVLRELIRVYGKIEYLRAYEPPTFDKPEYTPVCGYMDKNELRFIEQNDDTIRITGASGFSKRRNIIVEISKRWINSD